MAVQQQVNLNGWRSRALVGGLLSAAEKGPLAFLQGHRWGSVGETIEVSVLGALTSVYFPYVRRAISRIYRNSLEAARDPLTLGQLTENIRSRLQETIPTGYLIETAYSLATTPPVNSPVAFLDHMGTHIARGAVEGLIVSSIPFAVYGIRRGIVEPTINYLHAVGWL